MVRAFVAFLLLFVAPLVAADCEDEAYGSVIATGDSELSTTVAAASTSETPDFTVVLHDPDEDVGGDETYYLRFLVDADDDKIQEGDLNLRTGEIVDAGDDDTDFPSGDVDDAFDSLITFLGYTEGTDTFWYYDADSSGEFSRFDLRITSVSLDGEDYEAGTPVRLSDNDYDLFAQETPDDTESSLNNADFAWFDTDTDGEVGPGDCILFQPGGFDASPDAGDVRLTGFLPSSVDEPIVAGLSADVTSGAAPLAVTFALTGSGGDGSALAWELDVDGDGTTDADGASLPASFAHTYAAAGEFTVTLVVMDGDATATNTTTISVSATGTPPTPPGTPPDTPPGTPPSPPDGDDDGGEDDTIPGLSSVLLFAALAATAIVVRRRER